MKKHIRQLLLIFVTAGLSACGGGGGGGGAVTVTPAPPGGPTLPPLPPPPAGTAVLQWLAPTSNIDGSLPVLIAGYNIYRLTPGATPCPTDISLYSLLPPVSTGDLATVVGSPPPTQYADNALPAATYCYAVSALNFAAQESAAAFLAAPLTVN